MAQEWLYDEGVAQGEAWMSFEGLMATNHMAIICWRASALTPLPGG